MGEKAESIGRGHAFGAAVGTSSGSQVLPGVVQAIGGMPGTPQTHIHTLHTHTHPNTHPRTLAHIHPHTPHIIQTLHTPTHHTHPSKHTDTPTHHTRRDTYIYPYTPHALYTHTHPPDIHTHILTGEVLISQGFVPSHP